MIVPNKIALNQSLYIAVEIKYLKMIFIKLEINSGQDAVYVKGEMSYNF